MSVFNNEVERKRIKDCMHEIHNSMTRIEGERDFIKEAKKSICEELQLDKKLFNRMIKVYHNKNFANEVQADTEFEDMYSIITGQGSINQVDQEDA